MSKELFKIKNSVLIEVLDKNITNLIIPEGVVSIGKKVLEDEGYNVSISILYECNNLKSISLPKSFENYYDLIFTYNLKLEEVNVDENNKYYKSINGVLFDKENNSLLYYPINKIGDKYTIPTFVECIVKRAFVGSKVKEIEITNNVNTIEELAFYGSLLERVNISHSVKYIGNEAFGATSNLYDINVDNKNLYYKSVNGVMFNSDLTILIKYPTALTNEVYKTPSTIKEIDSFAFVRMKNLRNVILNEGLEIINSNNFNSEITSISIPSTLKFIKGNSFETVTKLEEFIVDINNEYYKSINGVLFSKDESVLIKYPSGNKRIEYTLPDSVIHIAPNAFLISNYLENIKLNKKLETIGSRNFMLFTCLKSITIEDKVEKIDMYAMEFNEFVKIILNNKNKKFRIEDGVIFDIENNCKLTERNYEKNL